MSLNSYINSLFSPLTAHHISRDSHANTPPCVIGKILVITVDGRTLAGTLLSCDQVTNLVLSGTIERIIRSQDDDEPSSEVGHGLYLIRGDNVVCVGLMDEELDGTIDWSKVRGEVIGTTRHV
jgi:U6 snRNA-associated Sm-like protein LSm8